MRPYTTPEQTAKLIELGFEKPKGLADAEPSSGKWVREAYSIGELIEILSCLPTGIDISAECVVTNRLGIGYGYIPKVKN